MKNYRRLLTFLGAFLVCFAVVSQFFLMLNNSEMPLYSVLVRFFSFFTILTNSLVAIYFISLLLPKSTLLFHFFSSPGKLTAITGYILVVGLVYQVALRHVWNPQGFAMLVDELLHSVIPLFTFIFWMLFETKDKLHFKQIGGWLLYPFAYIVYTFIRGFLTNQYPYPFVDVPALGYLIVFRNSFIIVLLFLLFFVAMIALSKRTRKAA